MSTIAQNGCGLVGCPCHLRGEAQAEEFLRRICGKYQPADCADLDELLSNLMSQPLRELDVELDLTQPEIQALISHLSKLPHNELDRLIARCNQGAHPKRRTLAVVALAISAAAIGGLLAWGLAHQ